MAANPLKRLRKRVETALASPTGQALPASLIAGHLRRAADRTAWEFDGRDALAAEVRGGQPVIFAIWHGRLMCAPRMWDPSWGRFTTLSSNQYPGRLAGQTMRRFGLETQAMHDRRATRAQSLALARAVREGLSLGITTDGPLGPARIAKTVPLEWSRLTGAPIWLVSFSLTRFWRANSWDKLLIPRAGGRACLLYRRWGVVPRKGADIETLRQSLQDDLTALSLEADRRMGHADLLS